jgi:hypothetical protein
MRIREAQKHADLDPKHRLKLYYHTVHFFFALLIIHTTDLTHIPPFKRSTTHIFYRCFLQDKTCPSLSDTQIRIFGEAPLYSKAS